MKKSLVLIALLLLVAIPALAARVQVLPITRDAVTVFQAYEGESDGNTTFAGYETDSCDVIKAVPGVLSIVPGDNWENFVGAAQAGVPYTIKNVVLCKTHPTIIQCNDVFNSPEIINPICQQGTPSIRLWWPLMYEIPGTTWKLTILYGTPTAWQDAPFNPASYVHTEEWVWQVDANLDSLENLLVLFHELPFGLDEVPLISDEQLYPILLAKLDAVKCALEPEDPSVDPDYVTAGLILGDFEMEVMDACIAESPDTPLVTGVGTGIANSYENPACCKILADVEYIGFNEGILQPNK